MTPAKTLRRAARAIREDLRENDPFMAAVADWLDYQASYAGTTGSHYNGGQSHGSHALAVANAYLQETP